MREVLANEPYKYRKGSKERGESWNKIAKILNSIPDAGLHVTQRGVRTQYEKLVDEFQKKQKEEIQASGIDCAYDELDQLLQDVTERGAEAAAAIMEEAEKKQNGIAEERKACADIRNQAMENMGNVQERKHAIKRKSTVLKELIEEGRKVKTEMELKRIALEEKRLEADNERQLLLTNVIEQQQQQQALLLEQQKQSRQVQQEFMQIHLGNQQQQQVFQQQQQKMMTELQVQNSQVQLELLKVLRDIKDK